VGAGSAFAGEVTGKGDPTPIQEGQAASICSFSGRNDGEPPPWPKAEHVQNWGQIPKEFGMKSPRKASILATRATATPGSSPAPEARDITHAPPDGVRVPRLGGKRRGVSLERVI
jgi:hypothetical protein